MLTELVLLINIGRDIAPDEMIIREQEAILASALRTGNRAVLYRLTDSNLHVSLECGSVVNDFRTDLHRDDWVDHVSQLRMTTYDAKISDLRLIRSQKSGNPTLKYGELASVSVHETTNFVTLRGETIKERLFVRDTWAKLESTWKLANRLYKLQACNDGPHLRLP